MDIFIIDLDEELEGIVQPKSINIVNSSMIYVC
jgi:hypothetical protein